MAAHRHREEVLNTVLARAMLDFGVQASPESIKSKGKERPDVIFAFRGLRCVVEGKYGDTPDPKGTVQADAQGRLDSGLAQIAIAVVYPKKLRATPFSDLQKEIKTVEIEFRVLSESSAAEWKSGTVEFLLAELRHAQEILAKDDIVQRVADELSARLEGVSRVFVGYPAICDRLTALLGVGRPAKETPIEARKRRDTSAKIAALAVANAYVFQELLAEEDDRVLPLRTLLKKPDLLGETSGHWDWICDNINYVPIFRIASDVLLSIPSGTPAEGAIRELANQAISVCSNKAALRHDLMGRIYHFLLHDAKYLGTYYTSVAGATLLLKLALDHAKWSSVDFGDIARLSEFRVADLACGTGTLLMAANQAITDNFIRARAAQGRRLDSKAFRNLHQAQMENILKGYDVLSSAIHLTASTLAILAPEISFRRMGLYTMPFGEISAKTIRLGSLDFFHADRLPIQVTIDGHGEGGGERITARGAVESQAPLESLDLCVMNPPFTRSVNSNLLFGSVPDARGRMQKELKDLITSKNVPATITAGLGSVFVALGTKYLKPNGRIALVLPAALTTGNAWQRTRSLVASDYVLEYVVTSHDPERWAFSENTDLSEVLVVARMKTPSDKDSEVTFVNLWSNVRTSAEALSVAHALTEKIAPAKLGTHKAREFGIQSVGVGGRKYGEVVSMPSALCKDVWVGGAFAQTDLLRVAMGIREGVLLAPGSKGSSKIPVTKLGSIATFGPDGRDIHDGFKLSSQVTSYPALWGTDGTRITTMAQSPNMWLEPLTKAAEGRPLRDVSQLWPRAGRVMISTRLRLTTQRLFATLLEEPALSNIWSPTVLTNTDPKKEKALVMWMNSTLGLLMAMLVRVPTEGPWIQFKKPNLSELLVLDIDAIPSSMVQKLARSYDKIQKDELKPYAAMTGDSTRKSIDGAIEEAFNTTFIGDIRKLLGREPVVCNKSLVTTAPKKAPYEYDLLSIFEPV